MTYCTECQTEWTFKDKAEMYKTLDTSKKCPYCREIQYVSFKSKDKVQSSHFCLSLRCSYLHSLIHL